MVSFQQLVTDLQTIDKQLNISSRFPLPKVDNKNYKLMYIDKLDDVVPIVLNENENIKFIYDGDLDDMLINMIVSKYIPDVFLKIVL